MKDLHTLLVLPTLQSSYHGRVKHRSARLAGRIKCASDGAPVIVVYSNMHVLDQTSVLQGNVFRIVFGADCQGNVELCLPKSQKQCNWASTPNFKLPPKPQTPKTKNQSPKQKSPKPKAQSPKPKAQTPKPKNQTPNPKAQSPNPKP